MNNRFLRLIQVCVLTLDLLTLNLLVILSQSWMERVNGAYSLEYARFWVWLNASWILVTWLSNLYYEKHIISFENFSRRSMHAYFYWVVLLMMYLFFTHQFGLSRLFIAIIFMCQGIMLLINRFIYLLIRSYYKRRNLFIRKVMIIGYNDTAKKLVSYLEEEGMNTEIVGFCEEPENVYELSNYPIVSSIANTIEVSHHHRVNEIYSTIAPEQDSGIYQLMKEADQACIHFRLIPDLSYFVKRVVYISYLKDMPVLSLRQEPLSDAGNRIRKRLFDIIFSIAVIVFLLSWLVPLLALFIWLDSRGPIFFKQPRTGQGKKTFNCFKFRSMRESKDAHTMQASRNDKRLTRLGKFIRKTSLDEMPQFFNVLRGDMSVVGPRPHMLKHTNDYSKLIDQYMVRQFLKPGITGWAQINGFRGETRTIEEMEGRVDHDIWYMENWGLWLDLRIIFLTGFNVFKGEKKAF
ncbi:MAG: undecaprenyl-phosphate glucose phosphotransferase [Chitinophagaceae bacterium]